MPRPTKKRKWLYILAALGLAYYAYGRFTGGGPGGWGMGGAAPVSVAEVVVRNVREWHNFPARIVAVDQAEVRPQVTGVIREIKFEDGALVQKGDPLFIIDPRPFAAEVTRAEGQLGSAMAQQALARSDMSRAQRLFKDKAIPQHEFDRSRNAVGVAEANVKSAQAALDMAKLNYDYALVKAPITGRASRAEITVGNLVEAGGSAPMLTSIVSGDWVYADFEIDEPTFLQYARAGMVGNSESVHSIPVSLTLNNDKSTTHDGFVKSFDNRINTASGTLRARAMLDNTAQQLVPGMFATVALGGPAEMPSLLITDRAIGTDQSKKFVLVVGPDNKTEHRDIKLGNLTADGLRIVKEGLKAGERIVVSGTQRVMMPGQEVTPELVAMDARPAAPQAPGAPAADTSEKAPQELAPAAKPADAPAETAPAESAPAKAEPAAEAPASQEAQ
jgi:membrane fusion protein, multidrug efflux system